MMASRSEMKAKAIELLKELNVNPMFASRFQFFDKIPYFDKHTPLFEEAPREILDKVKEIEKERGLLVYAITSDDLSFGKTYSFLVVSPYKEDWLYLMSTERLWHRVYAYVWNVTEEWRSESGSVCLLNHYGKLVRIG